MITFEHTVIRATEPDDAPWLAALYNDGPVRASLLDARREPVLPTVDELREALSTKEAAVSAFYTIEDRSGVIRGFCNARGTNTEASFGEINVHFFDEADLDAPLAQEAYDFIVQRAFERMRLRKVVTTLLDTEVRLRDWLLAHGFTSCGVQREVHFSSGRWHDLETLTLFADTAGFGAAA